MALDFVPALAEARHFSTRPGITVARVLNKGQHPNRNNIAAVGGLDTLLRHFDLRIR